MDQTTLNSGHRKNSLFWLVDVAIKNKIIFGGLCLPKMISCHVVCAK